MQEDSEISVQFVLILDERLFGKVIDSNNYYTVVEFEKHGILHREMFEDDDLIYLDEITINIETEEPE